MTAYPGSMNPKIKANKPGLNDAHIAIFSHAHKVRQLNEFLLPLVNKKTIKPMNKTKIAQIHKNNNDW